MKTKMKKMTAMDVVREDTHAQAKNMSTAHILEDLNHVAKFQSAMRAECDSLRKYLAHGIYQLRILDTQHDVLAAIVESRK